MSNKYPYVVHTLRLDSEGAQTGGRLSNSTRVYRIALACVVFIIIQITFKDKSNYSLPVLSTGQEFVAWQWAWMVNFNAANLATLVSSAAPFFVAPVLKLYWLDLSFVTGHK